MVIYLLIRLGFDIMNIERKWCMPNKHTFQIKPIKEFLQFHLAEISPDKIVDPFCGESTLAGIRNDIRFGGIDALDFLKKIETGSVSAVLFDPPYSLRQLKECYEGIGRALTWYESKFYFHEIKDEIKRITTTGSVVFSFGWNSGGMGMNRNFKMLDILLVPHGGLHNDTIVVKEIKK